jgi:DNA-binding MarR family transcriptional regulator
MLGAFETHDAALPVLRKLEPIPAEPRDLELLVEEVNALTLRLKQAIRVGEDAGGLLSATQCVLRWLLEGPKTVPQLARLRGTSRQNVQILVNRLTRQGLVAFAINPAHRRSVLVQLTEGGRGILRSVSAEHTLGNALSPRIAQNEVRSAVALLRRLRDSIAERQNASSITGAATAPPKHGKAAMEVRAKDSPPLTLGAIDESSISQHELPVNLL